MSQSDPPAEQLLEGIELTLLSRIVKCLREHYRTADKAVVYAETVTREYNIVGISNLRDALSHLSTAVDSSKSYVQREQSVKSMEGHVRRAVVESLQVAAEARLVSCSKTVTLLHDATSGPAATRVSTEVLGAADKGLDEALRLYREARDHKGENIWNREWEDGASLFVRCVNTAKETEADARMAMEAVADRGFQLRLSRRTLILSVCGAIVVSGAFFVLGLILR